MRKINLRAVAELTPREQRNVETYLRRIWRKYHPKPEQIQARQEQETDNDFNSETTEE